MRRYVFFSLIFFPLATPLLSAVEEIAVPSSAVIEPSWMPRWNEAKALAEKRNYLEAREIYESLLAQGESLEGYRSSLRREYENLQIKLIYSPLKTPESLRHEVGEGDTLSGLAQRYGTTVTLLKKSNWLTSADKILKGMTLKVPRTKFSILIRKRSNSLFLLADGKRLKRYSVATGEKGSTPAGTFKIVNKLTNPTWYHAGAVLPPGSPANILGSRWLGFDEKGYGIHGTTFSETIGSHASKGCVRMHNEEVEEIYDLLPLKTKVTITE